MKKHTLFVGLNDQNTKHQEISTLDAFKIAANIFRETTGGATISEAQGVYTHDNGEIVIEVTLRCEIYGANDSNVLQAVEMLKTALNQESILWDVTENNSRFA